MMHTALAMPLHGSRESSSADLQSCDDKSDDTDSNSNEGKLNGRAASVGEGIGDPVVSVTPVKRAVTPPPLPAPSKSIHSDMYNTVFALQSLGNGSWSDYLTRVRGLWDGHMNSRLSASGTSSLNGGKGTLLVLHALAEDAFVLGAAFCAL
jgi:hypothetical protein